jgi:cytochrome c biogenesis factor
MVDRNDELRESSEVKKEILAIEITEKPLINLLWLGTIIMISGLAVSLRNRIVYDSKK